MGRRTGKTPVRNARIPDEVWLPALAKAEAEGRTATEAMIEALAAYVAAPLASAYDFTLANWPAAGGWAERHQGAVERLHQDLAAALGPVPGEWLVTATWLAATHHPADPDQQKRVITGHILRRFADTPEARGRYRDSRHLSETIQEILARHVPFSAA